MKPETCRRAARSLIAFCLAAALAGCAAGPVGGRVDFAAVDTPDGALHYYQSLSRLSAADFARERGALAAAPKTPYTQVLAAMLLGYPRAQQDVARALTLLEQVLKSNEPAAVDLHPLARMLADNYLERLKLDAQQDKLGQQLKESQRRNAELQEKLDNLADIERTLPQRSGTVRPGGAR